MNATVGDLLYPMRWGVFLVRWTLYIAYGLLQFISKPGSRLIVPASLAAAAYAARSPLERILDSRLLHPQHLPEPLALQVAFGLGLVSLICVGVVLSPFALFIRGAVSVVFGVLGLAVRLLLLLIVVTLVWRFCRSEPLHFGEVADGFVRWARAALWGMPATFSNMRQIEGFLPEPATLHTILAVGVLLISCVYVVLSRALVLVLGAFPPVIRPLRPVRALRPKAIIPRPAIVRLAVPKLPPRKVPPERDALPGSTVQARS